MLAFTVNPAVICRGVQDIEFLGVREPNVFKSLTFFFLSNKVAILSCYSQGVKLCYVSPVHIV
jgi:hypothetical protein